MICATHSAATTKKYLIVASCEGVGFNPSNGSFFGNSECSGTFFCAPKYHTIPPTPASNTTKLITLQTIADPVGRLPTSSSCGQFCVYVTVWPGRSVDEAQAVHQKNAAICFCLAASTSALFGIAYSFR